MLSALKERVVFKKAKAKAIAASQNWKTHPHLQICLQALRGSCAVAPMQMHEAAVAVVNIALQEDVWVPADRIPPDFLGRTVYIVWDNAQLPVFKAERDHVLQHLAHVTAVSERTYLISEGLDRVVCCDHWGIYLLYSVAPQD